jgi:CysZ protein
MLQNLGFKFRDLIRGFTTPIRAAQKIFASPRLVFLSLFPIFISLLVAAFCIFAVLSGAWAAGNLWFQNIAGTYAQAASGIFSFVVGVFTLYLLFQSIGIILSFIASPFNDWLAEETERACGQRPQSLSFFSLIRVFFLDFRKTILTLSVSISLWFIALVPGLGLISPVGFALVTTLTFISYPQSRRHLGVIQCLIWMKENFAASLGFGFSTLILFGIPICNVFALPLSVVGGTLLFLESTAQTQKT